MKQQQIQYKKMNELLLDDLSRVKFDSCQLINTISPNSYGLMLKDQNMYEAIIGSDYLILDGVYFGLLSLVFEKKRIKRVTGWDSFQFFSKKINIMAGKVFFLGSSKDTLEKIKIRYKKEFPNIEVDYYSPPFKNEFEKTDNDKMHVAINAFKPDILFIGLTAPKQEKWSFENKNYLNVRVISTIGNVFDWYAGNSKRPNIFWQKIGMEWLVRVFIRPEIFRRNIVNQLTFFFHLFLLRIGIKKYD